MFLGATPEKWLWKAIRYDRPKKKKLASLEEEANDVDVETSIADMGDIVETGVAC